MEPNHRPERVAHASDKNDIDRYGRPSKYQKVINSINLQKRN
jgi:hypothetical protein